MELKEFIQKYNGQKVDFDGVYGAQCVDLVRQYFKDVWELPFQPEGVEGAKDFYFKHESRMAQKRMMNCIMYHPGMVPPAGAVVVFGENIVDGKVLNQYGHIGICIEATESSILLFEQDGIKQDGAKLVEWQYGRVLGWLVKKE